MKSNANRFWLIMPWIIYLLISLGYLVAGNLHLDEGAYLYAARAVYNGQIPYRDFFFLQPPLHPYIYGLIQCLLPGLFVARITSILFGLLSTILLVKLASRLGQSSGKFIFLIMMTMAPFQLYFFSITRLYALTAFFISAGCCLIFSTSNPTLTACFTGMIAFAAAVGTRLTTAPLFALAALYLLFRIKSWRIRFLSIISGFVVLLGIYLPFIAAAGIERFWFNVMGMNLSLHSHNPGANLIQKARATSQLVQFYFPVWLMLLPLLFGYLKRIRSQSFQVTISSLFTSTGMLWIMSLSLILIHCSAKLYQVSYQTIIMPVLICLTAIEWSRLYHDSSSRAQRTYRAFFLALWIMGLLAYGRTSIAFYDGKPALVALWEQASFIQEHTCPEDRIFSADSALVPTEAERDVLPGMAGSDLFPDWSTDKCHDYNVLNFDIMSQYVQNQAGSLLMMGDLSFNVSLPFLEPVPEALRDRFKRSIADNYELLATFPNLLLPGTKTYYYKPRSISSPQKLLIFGIDAVGWDILLPLIQSGDMPNFKRVFDSGAAARMKTLEPTVSVMLWTTIATGTLPEKHGINNWLMESADSSGQQAITSDKRRVAAFWNVTGDKKTGIVNWWATWPVEPVNGIMVSNRAHYKNIANAVFPENAQYLLDMVPKLRVEDLERELTVLNPLSTPIHLPPFFAEQLIKDRFYLDVAKRLVESNDLDILAVFVRGIDILQHEYLRDVREDVMEIPEVGSEQKGIVRSYYRYLDRWLGTFLETLGPGTGLMIVSDHGMDPVLTLPPLVEGLNLDKLLETLGSLNSGDPLLASFVDNNRYPPGLVRGLRWTGIGSATVVDTIRVMDTLKIITFDGSKPLFDDVSNAWDNDETIHLKLNPEPKMNSVITWNGHTIPMMEVTNMIIHPRAGQHWHSPDGIFLISGPGIEPSSIMSEIRIVDIMPTLLEWLGLPVSRELDGVPQDKFFSTALRLQQPIQWVDSFGLQTDRGSVDVPEEVKADLRRELESLGYIQTNRSIQ
ncbi:alkaline phosphatase family protein [bacterium]|nr:alkaline phosphatase family protein [candidate division CSSED10-310 bacterium]